MRLAKKSLAVAVFAMLIVGCESAPFETALRFSGPGTFEDFAKARYSCLQENTRQVSGLTATQYGVFGRSRSVPSCSALGACMVAKGYFRSPEGQFSAKGIEIECD
ncbi:MAG: hypothetical protein Q8L16_23115 [Hydrogenophaga sp.]|nr:hypothetical protein [Hydrogenophaga sp.]